MEGFPTTFTPPEVPAGAVPPPPHVELAVLSFAAAFAFLMAIRRPGFGLFGGSERKDTGSVKDIVASNGRSLPCGFGLLIVGVLDGVRGGGRGGALRGGGMGGGTAPPPPEDMLYSLNLV